MLRVVADDDSRAEMRSAIDEICAEGARRIDVLGGWALGARWLGAVLGATRAVDLIRDRPAHTAVTQAMTRSRHGGS